MCCFNEQTDKEASIILYDLQENKYIKEIFIENGSVSSPIEFDKNGDLTIATKPDLRESNIRILNFSNYLNGELDDNDVNHFISSLKELSKEEKINDPNMSNTLIDAVKDIINDCKFINGISYDKDALFEPVLCDIAARLSIDEYLDNIVVKIVDLFIYSIKIVDSFLDLLNDTKFSSGSDKKLAGQLKKILIDFKKHIFPDKLLKKLNIHKNSLTDFPEIKLKIRISCL